MLFIHFSPSANIPYPLPIGLFYYTILGDDGGDVVVGGNIKGGV